MIELAVGRSVRKEFEFDGREITTQTFKGTDRVEIRMGATEAEAADYHERWRAIEDERARGEQAEGPARTRRPRGRMTCEAWKDSLLENVDFGIGLMLRFAAGKGRKSLRDEDRKKLQQLTAQIRATINGAPVMVAEPERSGPKLRVVK